MLRGYRGVRPVVGESCYVDESAQLIGDVVLGARSSVWMNAVLRGDVNAIRVGEESNVQDGAVLHGMKDRYAVRVGDRVTIGHGAVVHGCVLEDEVLVGIGAMVLNDARVGTGSIVAAGALVPEHMVVPPGSLVVGVPARVKRSVTEADREMIRQHARNYVEYRRVYLEEGGE